MTKSSGFDDNVGDDGCDVEDNVMLMVMMVVMVTIMAMLMVMMAWRWLLETNRRLPLSSKVTAKRSHNPFPRGSTKKYEQIQIHVQI